MLDNLKPIRKTPFDMVRLSLAIVYYLPCFDKTDTKAEPYYNGYPVFPVHGRIVAAGVLPNKWGGNVQIKFLAMNSVLAGRVYDLKFRMNDAVKILRHIYVGKNDLVPVVGLSGCYCNFPSSILASPIYGREELKEIDVNSEETLINHRLYQGRAKGGCKHCDSCYSCLIGRDRCGLSVRRKTEVNRNDDKEGSEGIVRPVPPEVASNVAQSSG